MAWAHIKACACTSWPGCTPYGQGTLNGLCMHLMAWMYSLWPGHTQWPVYPPLGLVTHLMTWAYLMACARTSWPGHNQWSGSISWPGQPHHQESLPCLRSGRKKLPVKKLVDNFDASYSYVANEGTTFYFKVGTWWRELTAAHARIAACVQNKCLAPLHWA